LTPLASRIFVCRPLARPITEGRSPCKAKSSWPLANASFTAGPAPAKKNQAIFTPGSDFSSSST